MAQKSRFVRQKTGFQANFGPMNTARNLDEKDTESQKNKIER